MMNKMAAGTMHKMCNFVILKGMRRLIIGQVQKPFKHLYILYTQIFCGQAIDQDFGA